MLHRAISALCESLRPRVGLSKSRLETLCLLVVGMVSARTVNLGHIACERPGNALIASTYRRLQRFFQHVRLGQDWSLPLVVELLGLRGSWHLALDRTQWQIGERDVNVLVLAVIARRVRVPLLWTVLDKRGSSGTDERIALMQRYLARFPASSIRMLLADREFAGTRWLKFLHDNNIFFAIRLKDNRRITTEDGHDLTLLARLQRTHRTCSFRGRLGKRHDPQTGDGPLLAVAAKRLKGEWLIVASNRDPKTALAAYKKRWAIECLFGDAKTRGLNVEDTRLTDPRKLNLLMALVALALAWAARTAADRLCTAEPKRKRHGYYAQSGFRTGFDLIRTWLRSDPIRAIAPWRRITAIPTIHLRVV